VTLSVGVTDGVSPFTMSIVGVEPWISTVSLVGIAVLLEIVEIGV
jgi:hypothetical protein